MKAAFKVSPLAQEIRSMSPFRFWLITHGSFVLFLLVEGLVVYAVFSLAKGFF